MNNVSPSTININNPIGVGKGNKGNVSFISDEMATFINMEKDESEISSLILIS